MDPMELLGGLEEGGGECQPALPDIDIDLLVPPAFNNNPPRNSGAIGKNGTLEDRTFCDNGDVSQENPFLDFGSIIDFSPQHVDDTGLHLDKGGIFSYFGDPTSEDICTPTNEEHNTSEVLASCAGGPAVDKALIEEASVDPMANSMHNMYAPTSLVMQNEWQDLAALLPCKPQHVIPSSVVNDVKMLPLEGQGEVIDHTRALRTQQSRGDAIFVPKFHQPIQNRQSPNSLHSNATGPSIPFQLPGASSQLRSLKERPYSKTLQTPLRRFKRKDGKMKTDSLPGTLPEPSMATETAPSTTPRKKSNGRRKMSANAHLSLEERKRLRAERNRESAEKSRMRRKQMVLDLETNVQALRDENRDLKAKVERYHARLKSAKDQLGEMPSSAEGTLMQDGSMASGTLLVEALNALQVCMEQCPRTFKRNPQSPVIPLNVAPKRHTRPL